jgi:hypothetical protein
VSRRGCRTSPGPGDEIQGLLILRAAYALGPSNRERATAIAGKNQADLPEKQGGWHRNCACQYPVASVGPAVVIGFVGGMRVKVAVTSGGSSMLHGGWPRRPETVCRRSSGISLSYQSLTCSPRYTTSPAPPSLASAASSSVEACHRRSSSMELRALWSASWKRLCGLWHTSKP